MIDLAALGDRVVEAIERRGLVRIENYKAADDLEINEYCLFLKPELATLGRKFRPVAQVVADKLDAFGEEIVAATAMEASYIARHKLAEQHYGVINKISQEGWAAVSEEAKHRAREVFGSELENEVEILGADQFLERYPFFTAEALAVFYDSLKNVKLAPGTHCVRALVRGKATLILNGFHPEQLKHYTRTGAAILALAVRSRQTWKTIREKLTGATNPSNAIPESIRGTLLIRRTELGLSDVSPGRNGVHVSAGPIEGMVEICRYMTDFEAGEELRPEDTTFGRLLSRLGGGGERVNALCRNPIVNVEGKQVSAFDYTEEVDARDACGRLRDAGLA